MRRVRVVAAIVCSLGLLFLGAPAASSPIGPGDRADRSRSLPDAANGPIVFDWYSESFVVEPSDPGNYYEPPSELQVEIPSVSPDGRFLAWPGSVPSSDPWGECCELFVAELDGDNPRQITDESLYPGRQGPAIRRGRRMVVRSWSSTAACGSSTFGPVSASSG